MNILPRGKFRLVENGLSDNVRNMGTDSMKYVAKKHYILAHLERPRYSTVIVK